MLIGQRNEFFCSTKGAMGGIVPEGLKKVPFIWPKKFIERKINRF